MPITLLQVMCCDAFNKSVQSDAVRAVRLHEYNPDILLWSYFGCGGHSKYVVNEFPLGVKYRTDFVIAFSVSGAWDVYLIELENTDDMVITKAGTPSQRFRSAISQINDWRDYVERNRSQVLQDLSDWCVKKDLLGWDAEFGAPCNFTGNYLRDPNSSVTFNYRIIIGRRDNISREMRRKMNQDLGLFTRAGTYDRFIDLLKDNRSERLFSPDYDSSDV